jgi:hypothetical protein
VEKFYDCLKDCKTKKPLEDLAIEGMTVEEFWQHGNIFNTLDFDLNVELVELYTIFHLQMLDITMMTVWCM